MIEIERFIVGPLQTNCYLIRNNKSLVIIDPGSAFRRIDQYIIDNELKLEAILLTHAHFDHIGAVDSLVKKYKCDVYLDQDDWNMVKNAKIYDFNTTTSKLSSELKDYPSKSLTLPSFNFSLYKTPGHTNGSVCLMIEKHLFTGDTLFNMGVGRTDLYGGSEHKLKESLLIFNIFPDETIVHPGHESESTIDFELKNNPYLN